MPALAGALKLFQKSEPDGSTKRYFYGLASVAILDKQGDILAGPALEKALPQLLRRARISLNHQDILPGEILESFEVGGRIYKTEVRPLAPSDLDEFPPAEQAGAKVGDSCLFLAANIYDDAPFCDMVWKKMQDGDINCLSISGQALAHTPKMDCSGLTCKATKEITDMALSAVTLCKIGANPAAFLSVLSKAEEVVTIPGPNFTLFRKSWQFPLGTEEATNALLDQMDARVRKGLDNDGAVAQAAAHLRNYMGKYGFSSKYIDDHNTVHAESGKVLGHHDTKAEAVAQLQAIEANKHAAKDCGTPTHLTKECPCFMAPDEQPAAKDIEAEAKYPPRDKEVEGEANKDTVEHTLNAVGASTQGGAFGAAPPPKVPRLPKRPTQGAFEPIGKALRDLELRFLEKGPEDEPAPDADYAAARRLAPLMGQRTPFFHPTPEQEANRVRLRQEQATRRATADKARTERNQMGANVAHQTRTVAPEPEPRGLHRTRDEAPEGESYSSQSAARVAQANLQARQKPMGQGMAEAPKARGLSAAKAALAEGKSPQAILAAARGAQQTKPAKKDVEDILGKLEKDADRPIGGEPIGPGRRWLGTTKVNTHLRNGDEVINNTKVRRLTQKAKDKFQRLNKSLFDIELDQLEKGAASGSPEHLAAIKAYHEKRRAEGRSNWQAPYPPPAKEYSEQDQARARMAFMGERTRVTEGKQGKALNRALRAEQQALRDPGYKPKVPKEVAKPGQDTPKQEAKKDSYEAFSRNYKPRPRGPVENSYTQFMQQGRKPGQRFVPKDNGPDPIINPRTGRRYRSPVTGQQRIIEPPATATVRNPKVDVGYGTEETEERKVPVRYPGRHAWEVFQGQNKDAPRMEINGVTHPKPGEQPRPLPKDDELAKNWRPFSYTDRAGIMRTGATNGKSKLYGSDAQHALGEQAQSNSPSAQDSLDDVSTAPPTLEQRVRALEMKVGGKQSQDEGGDQA